MPEISKIDRISCSKEWVAILPSSFMLLEFRFIEMIDLKFLRLIIVGSIYRYNMELLLLGTWKHECRDLLLFFCLTKIVKDHQADKISFRNLHRKNILKLQITGKNVYTRAYGGYICYKT